MRDECPASHKKDIAYLTEQEVDASFRLIRSPRDRGLFRPMYHHVDRRAEWLADWGKR
jgi:hypothetical protein